MSELIWHSFEIFKLVAPCFHISLLIYQNLYTHLPCTLSWPRTQTSISNIKQET
jgi:hypothetical protein